VVSTALRFQAFRELLSKTKVSDSQYEENFFELVEAVREEQLSPMMARRLMLDAGMRWQRVNEVFRIARMGKVDYRHWRERFIGFQAALSTLNKNAS